MNELRYVSRGTEKALYDVESKSNGTKIGVVVEEGEKSDEKITAFEPVKSKDITKEINLGDINWGVSLLHNKEKTKMEQTKKEEVETSNVVDKAIAIVESKKVGEVVKFVNFNAFDNRVKRFKSKKGVDFVRINCRFDKDGQKLPKGTYVSAILNVKHIQKTQKYEENSLVSFWLFADEKIKLQKSIKNEETGEYTNADYGFVDAKTFKSMN